MTSSPASAPTLFPAGVSTGVSGATSGATSGGTSGGGEVGQFADQLRRQTLACRVRHERIGVRRALSREQIARAAQAFDAEPGSLSARKRILDTKHPMYRRVIEIRSRAGKYWKSVSVPYPEPGIRLIRRDRVDAFVVQLTELQNALHEAAAELQTVYAELRERARVDLGDLFNAGDYPERIDREFALWWDFPSIEPPQYLRDLHPQIYEAECERVRVRLEEAVRLTEAAFAEQFQQLVSHLAERLRGDVDGKPKRFHASTVKNMQDFFEQFRELNLGSNTALDELVRQAQGIVAGVDAEDLRDSADLRQHVGDQMAAIQQGLDALMVSRPTRAIDLPPIDEEEAA